MNSDPSTPQELEGYVLYLRHAAGSKSDSPRPYLVVAGDTVVRLHRKGGNPFQEDEFRAFEGQRCAVQGHWDERAKVFMVEKITPVEGLAS
jgi:hypothetical protein